MPLIFDYLSKKNNYSESIKKCVKETLTQLQDKCTDANHPGVLLGKIQSGKTKTFIGIIGLAFDKEYDLCIVLTKGTKVLADQTLRRLEAEFDQMTQEGEDVLRVYDIMKIPELFPYDLAKKLILVAKKQTKNLDRLSIFFEKYPSTANKKILFIDDEADYASVGFQNSNKGLHEEGEISLRTIANKIDKLRGLSGTTHFLQVTATPYALYLQPDEESFNRSEYCPTRPKFTQLVPIHDQYVGGKVYFEGLHENDDSPLPWASLLHIEVPHKEIEVLGKPDGRYISNIMTSSNLQTFRSSIINFLVGGSIRALQLAPKQYKCSFIIHTATGKDTHRWQHKLVGAAVNALKQDFIENKESTIELLKSSIESFQASLKGIASGLPSGQQIIDRIKMSLIEGHIAIRSINSDNDIQPLLDKRGQLQLCNPFNIFVGGQILDRGITIENLLGFFYGRNPKTIQQDTVLQHSRMYGARPVENMLVTRLYTTARLRQAMKKMHDFDSALRIALEQGQYKNGVVFLEKDITGEIKPCSPNKILISHTTTLTPHKRYLPIGFEVKSKTKLAQIIPKIDSFIYDNIIKSSLHPNAYEMNLKAATGLLQQISDSYENEKNEDYYWDVDAMIGVLERCCSSNNDSQNLYCLILEDRNMSRRQSGGSFSDAPDGGSVLSIAKDLAQDKPCIILTKQNGKETDGWKGHEFWWPVVITPKNTKIAIFASRINHSLKG